MGESRGGEAALVETARERIETGRLPAVSPRRTWGGPGSGAGCALCDLPVTPLEIEFEVEFAPGSVTPRVLHFHRQCHGVWDAERRAPPGRALRAGA
jgi:hypothetical protein